MSLIGKEYTSEIMGMAMEQEKGIAALNDDCSEAGLVSTGQRQGSVIVKGLCSFQFSLACLTY